MQTKRGPLHGIKVLDVSIMAAGPWTAALLGMLGAEVVKVEPPAGDATRWALPTQNGMGTNFMAMNVNKKDIILDMKTEAGRAQALALAASADIIVQNFRVGVIDKLGLGYETVSALNPRVVYCSISGFGEEGPLRHAGCADPIMQAFSGFGRLNGGIGEEVEAFRFTGFIDLATASVAAQSILAALVHRDETGLGQEVCVSMLEAALEMQGTRVAEWLAGAEMPRARGSQSAAFAPDRAYRTLDRQIFVSVCSENQWTGFCHALERPALAQDARFLSNTLRVRHLDALDAFVAPLIALRPALWWLRVFERNGVPCALEQHFETIRRHQQVVDNGLIAAIPTREWGEISVAGLPWSFSRTPCEVMPPPAPGEHTAEVLDGLGRDAGTLPVPTSNGVSSLRGLQVIELAEGIAGPLAGLRLAELGADVIKVETAAGDWLRGAYPHAKDEVDAASFVDLNRGKRSIALGTNAHAAKQVLRRLLGDADILITDWTEVRLAAAGIGDFAVDSPQLNPDLIVVSVSAWGARGPLSAMPGSELTVQAMAGYTRYLGAYGEDARRLGADVASVGTGIFAMQAALAALYARRRGGGGQRVDVSMWGTLLAMKSIHLAAQSNPDEYKGPRVGGANNPPELGWQTGKGRVFIQFGGSVGPTGRAGWEAFVEEVGLAELRSDKRCDQTGRSSTGHGTYVHELRATYEAAFEKYTADEVAVIARKHGGNASPYYRLDETLAHPQTQAIGLLCNLKSVQGAERQVRRFPARFSSIAPKLSADAPRVGQHVSEILTALGYQKEEAAALYMEAALVRPDDQAATE